MKHHHAVSTFARSISSDPSIAEEAVQETFLKAWKYFDSFRGEGSFEGWLIRICRNCVYDLEKASAKNQVLSRMASAPSQTIPDEQTETLELLASLPISQREAIVLCGILGYDYSTAARILDVPIGTVRSRLHRGRSALADALAAAELSSVDTESQQRPQTA